MTSPVSFVKESISELKQVTYPSREDVVKLTIVVLVISVVVGIYIGGIDLILTEVTKEIVNK